AGISPSGLLAPLAGCFDAAVRGAVGRVAPQSIENTAADGAGPPCSRRLYIVWISFAGVVVGPGPGPRRASRPSASPATAAASVGGGARCTAGRSARFHRSLLPLDVGFRAVARVAL